MMTMPPARQTWANLLFWITLAVVAVLTIQQFASGGGGRGEPVSLAVAFLIPSVFPIGMALWGKKTGMIGPALGGIGMLVLFWMALVISQS